MGLISSLKNMSMDDLSLLASASTKFASGTVSVASNWAVNVTGLTFTPKLVILNYFDGTYAWRKSYNSYGTNATWSDFYVYGATSTGSLATNTVNTGWTITANGFSTDFSPAASATTQWVAIG